MDDNTKVALWDLAKDGDLDITISRSGYLYVGVSVQLLENIGNNKFSLKQIPKINGGIVVMDPYTGRVIALSGGFSFKNSDLIEPPKL